MSQKLHLPEDQNLQKGKRKEEQCKDNINRKPNAQKYKLKE
jgi:hypothetical protein